jgi:hypothetical protein
MIGAYYEEEHWKREWTYVALMPIASAFYAVVFLILGYHAVVQLLKVDPTVRCPLPPSSKPCYECLHQCSL